MHDIQKEGAVPLTSPNITITAQAMACNDLFSRPDGKKHLLQLVFVDMSFSKPGCNISSWSV